MDTKRISELPAAHDLAGGDFVVVVQPTGLPAPLRETRRATVAQVTAAVGAAVGSPVVSVAGRAGDVALAIADVAGLAPAIAGKAEALHRHAYHEVEGLEAIASDGGNF